MPTPLNDLPYWIAISHCRKVGAVRFRQLYENFPDMKTVWHDATTMDLTDAGWPEHLATEFMHHRATVNPEQLYQDMLTAGVSVITIFDNNYPQLLKHVYDPPALLFYKGSLDALQHPAIALVGTRMMSAYGKHMTTLLAHGLSQRGFTVVSGLALGIDAQAHATALSLNGPTIAVLGSGLDDSVLYPAANRPLAHQILKQQGLLLSEYPPNVMPMKYTFPLRNRIIAGLSLGTVVIEAGEISGALITAQYALDNNREVFAVPGNASSDHSAGTNKLIKDGAHLVSSVDDILEVLQLRDLPQLPPAPPRPASEAARLILPCLGKEPTHVNTIVAKSHLPVTTVNAHLMLLELQGQIKNLGNNEYIVLF